MSQRNDREGFSIPSLSSRPRVTNEVRRAAWLAGAALGAIALTVASLALSELRTLRWVHHSREVSRLARAALTYAVDAESGLRGFLVTHDRRSLEPQELAAARIGATLDSLVGLTADNQARRTAALDLRTAIRAWGTEFARPVIKTGTLTAATANQDLAGKPLFDVVRARADQFIRAEDSLYSVRLDHSRRMHWLATVAVCIEIVLAMLGLAWLVRQIIARVRAEEEQQVELQNQAAELEVQAAELEEQAAELEMTNDELARAATEAHDARLRAESMTRQKTRLAALLDAALSSAPTGFGFFDHDLRFLRANAMLARIHGKAAEDLVGLTLAEIDPEMAKEVEPVMQRVKQTRTGVTNVEFRSRAAAHGVGARSWLSSFFPIVTEDGELFGIGVVVTDVTGLKQLEEQLLQSQKMEAVGRLAGGVAHDFNNLLTVINSYAELMLFDPEMAHGKEEVQEIRGAAARAAKLTRQLLAFSRRQALEPRIVNPNDVLRGVETLLRRLVVGSVDITTNFSTETPVIRVDPGQLEQVVMNLAINAADAMPEGGALTIETACDFLDEKTLLSDPMLVPGPYAMIRVRDTGHGMDSETLGQIFEPFFTTKEPGRGTGLGLSMVYGIVKQSGGHVAVNSQPGAGTVFSVYLPAVGETAELATS
jgi:PAS domain S-box-containing protein